MEQDERYFRQVKTRPVRQYTPAINPERLWNPSMNAMEYVEEGTHGQPGLEQLTLPGVEEHLKKHPLQPHQMSRAQYERDPQTMWRAEGSDTLGSRHYWVSSGVHFGDYAAAAEMAQSRANEKSDEHPVRMFSLRTKGRFSNEPVADHPAAEVLPQTKGVAPDKDIGNAGWPQYRTGRWYLNEAEGYKSDTDRGPANTPIVRVGVRDADPIDKRSSGTLSGYVPRREGFLTTHSEEVLKAHAEGKSVHPDILQQAQMGPEYSETRTPKQSDAQKRTEDHMAGVRTLERPEHPAKLFQTLNPLAGKVEQIDIPTRGGGVIEHYVEHSHARYVSNEDYDEALRKHAANRAGEKTEPILSHIGESRPAGSPR